MSRLRTRMLAAGTAMFVAAAVAIPATAPAFATPGTTFNVVPSKDFADVGDPNTYFTVELDGLPSSCIETRPVVTWSLSIESTDGPLPGDFGTFVDPDDVYNGVGGISDYWHYWLPLADFQAGEVYTLEASSADPCFGDGQTFSDSAVITINGGEEPEEGGEGGEGEEPYEYLGEDTVTGTVWEQMVEHSTSPADYAGADGAEVALLDWDTWNAVDTAVVGPTGAFELTAPVEDVEGEERPYIIAANVDGDYFYYAAGATPSSPSPEDDGDATLIAPYQFEAETSYDIYAGSLPAIDETVWELICAEDGELEEDVATSSVFWEELCLTDGSISDAELANLDDAFDDFGYIVFPSSNHVPDSDDFDNDYFVSADTHSFSTTSDGAILTFSDDVTARDTDGDLVEVDVDVTVTITGSWVRWAVTVVFANTSTPASNVPFYLVGNLGSDSSTIWEDGDGVAVSWDDDNGDPLIGHRVISGGAWFFEDGDDEVALAATGTLTYELALMDWCDGGEPMAEAFEIIGDAAFGSAIPVLGDVCPAGPTWSIPAPSWKVGVAYDHTFTAPSAAPWDWNWGGSLEAWDLPDGLEWEIVDEWENGTAPGLRIFGTPTTAGPYSFWVYLEDDYGNEVDFDVTGTVAPAGSGGGSGDPDDETDLDEERDLDLTLDLELGEQVSGSEATATASGLEEGADYDLVVRSTPQTVGVGTVPTGGTVVRTVTLPTLEAGWHSLTFTSTWAGGGAAVAKVWFQVSATGTLLAVTYSQPNLAVTGASDPSGNLWLGATALLLGIGMVAFRRRRTAQV